MLTYFETVQLLMKQILRNFIGFTPFLPLSPSGRTPFVIFCPWWTGNDPCRGEIAGRSKLESFGSTAYGSIMATGVLRRRDAGFTLLVILARCRSPHVQEPLS
jgi:hypothetical protein